MTSCYSVFLWNFIITFAGKKSPAFKVKMSPCFNWAPRHEGVLGAEVQLHAFSDLGTRWRWVVSFMSQPLYPQGKSPWYSLDRRLGGSQTRSGRGGEEKNSQPPPGIESSIIQPVAQCYTTELIRISSAMYRKHRESAHIYHPAKTMLSLPWSKLNLNSLDSFKYIYGYQIGRGFDSGTGYRPSWLRFLVISFSLFRQMFVT
jgi:hypothetical protein